MGWARNSRGGEEQKNRERYTDEPSHGSRQVTWPSADEGSGMGEAFPM
jgi:hypothetical protein